MTLKQTLVWATKVYLVLVVSLGVVAVLAGDDYGSFLAYALLVSPLYYAANLLLYGVLRLRRR